jgi:hypothetical protein
MPRVIANTTFAGRLEEITELQTNLSIISRDPVFCVRRNKFLHTE